jgi:hypothetical protein
MFATVAMTDPKSEQAMTLTFRRLLPSVTPSSPKWCSTAFKGG